MDIVLGNLETIGLVMLAIWVGYIAYMQHKKGVPNQQLPLEIGKEMSLEIKNEWIKLKPDVIALKLQILPELSKLQAQFDNLWDHLTKSTQMPNHCVDLVDVGREYEKSKTKQSLTVDGKQYLTGIEPAIKYVSDSNNGGFIRSA